VNARDPVVPFERYHRVLGSPRPTDAPLERRRLLLGLDETDREDHRAVDLGEHTAIHGTLSLRLSSVRRRSLLVDFEAAGLQGRGGAGFPFAKKLQSVLSAGRGRPAVVANGSEGDPLSAKDLVLLTRVPHLVLDGVSLVAQILGSEAGIVVARSDAVEALNRAIAEREEAGMDPLPLVVVAHEVEDVGYAGGEASAVCEWLTTGRPLPRSKPPRVSEHGVAGRPTLVSNVETFAHVALIARHGPDWFRAEGMPDDPGTMLVTLAGQLWQPGVVEVPRGVAIRDLLEYLAEPTEPPQAILLGGVGGTWMSLTSALERSLTEPSLRNAQASLGSGGLYVLGSSRCGLVFSATIARWLARQTTGQCGPCYRGLPVLAELLGALSAPSVPDRRTRSTLVRIANELHGRGACGLPSASAEFVLSALETFAAEIDLHRAGSCIASETAPALTEVRHPEEAHHPEPTPATVVPISQARVRFAPRGAARHHTRSVDLVRSPRTPRER